MSAPSPVLNCAKAASDIGFPLFSPGQMLQHDDLTALADYTRMLMQLMLKSFFGCGVVCGLCVKAVFQCNKLTVTVAPGVAVDCCGNLIHVKDGVTIVIDPSCDVSSFQRSTPLWVVLREYEKGCAPRAATCPSDGDEVKNVCTREVYWYEVQVRNALPDCYCGCIARRSVDPQEGGLVEVSASDVQPEMLRREDCYLKHKQGVCECECACSGPCGCDCGGEWIVLASVTVPDAKTLQAIQPGDPVDFEVDHSVRRYVRPRLAPDYQCGQAVEVKRMDPARADVANTLRDSRDIAKPAPLTKPKTARTRSAGNTPKP